MILGDHQDRVITDNEASALPTGTLALEPQAVQLCVHYPEAAMLGEHSHMERTHTRALLDGSAELRVQGISASRVNEPPNVPQPSSPLRSSSLPTRDTREHKAGVSHPPCTLS